MSRIKAAFLSGTITDNPLTIGATTINSAALAGLPVIASPDIAVLVLDPGGGDGAPEVVHITAHSSSATSATITRAMEGTTAREHVQTTPWTHGPTVMDFTQRKGTAIASASTLTLPDSDADYFEITGSTTITAVSARAAGKKITLRKTGSDCSITHHATSLILIGGTDKDFVVGDTIELISEDSGNWRQVGANNNTYLEAGMAGVTLTNSGTYYNDGTITVTPGTWLVMASFYVSDTVGYSHYNFAIREGSTVKRGTLGTSGTSAGYVAAAVVTVVTLTADATYYASMSNNTRGGSTGWGNIVAVKLY